MLIKSPKHCAEIYEQRTYNTYLARVKQHKRLKKRRSIIRCASAVLDLCTIMWIVLPVLIADLTNLSENKILFYALMATVLTAASVFWGQFREYMDLDIRVFKAHQGYVLIQSLSQKFELLKDKKGLEMDELKPLIAEYTNLLLSTENHESNDFFKTLIPRKN